MGFCLFKAFSIVDEAKLFQILEKKVELVNYLISFHISKEQIPCNYNGDNLHFKMLYFSFGSGSLWVPRVV